MSDRNMDLIDIERAIAKLTSKWQDEARQCRPREHVELDQHLLKVMDSLKGNFPTRIVVSEFRVPAQLRFNYTDEKIRERWTQTKFEMTKQARWERNQRLQVELDPLEAIMLKAAIKAKDVKLVTRGQDMLASLQSKRMRISATDDDEGRIVTALLDDAESLLATKPHYLANMHAELQRQGARQYLSAILLGLDDKDVPDIKLTFAEKLYALLNTEAFLPMGRTSTAKQVAKAIADTAAKLTTEDIQYFHFDEACLKGITRLANESALQAHVTDKNFNLCLLLFATDYRRSMVRQAFARQPSNQEAAPGTKAKITLDCLRKVVVAASGLDDKAVIDTVMRDEDLVNDLPYLQALATSDYGIKVLAVVEACERKALSRKDTFNRIDKIIEGARGLYTVLPTYLPEKPATLSLNDLCRDLALLASKPHDDWVSLLNAHPLGQLQEKENAEIATGNILTKEELTRMKEECQKVAVT